MDDVALPPGLALLWDRQAAPRRGPKPALSLETVVSAAVALADADGLAQLSMARVAERLGYTTMSLYRYVKSKDDLLTLMADAANADPPPPSPASWRAGLGSWARGVFANYRTHPWLLHIPISGPPAGPSQLRWMEAGLQNLSAVDLPEETKLGVIQLLHGYVRGEAQFSADLAAAAPQAAPGPTYGQILRAVTTPETHPALSRLVATGILDAPTEYDPDVDFAFGLDRVLDGIAALVARPC